MSETTPHPTTVLLARGTLARLTLWPALRLAVHASWGGPASAEKQRWLAGVLVDQFEPFIPTTIAAASSSSDAAPDDVYIEELLLQIMADEFDVVLEDDSAAPVARDIVRLFGAVCAGDDAFVHELEAQADRIRGRVPVCERVGDSESEGGGEWEDDSGDDDDGKGEGESVPRLLDHSVPPQDEPQVDEDGFTLVTKKGRR